MKAAKTLKKETFNALFADSDDKGRKSSVSAEDKKRASVQDAVPDRASTAEAKEEAKRAKEEAKAAEKAAKAAEAERKKLEKRKTKKGFVVEEEPEPELVTDADRAQVDAAIAALAKAMKPKDVTRINDAEIANAIEMAQNAPVIENPKYVEPDPDAEPEPEPEPPAEGEEGAEPPEPKPEPEPQYLLRVDPALIDQAINKQREAVQTRNAAKLSKAYVKDDKGKIDIEKLREAIDAARSAGVLPKQLEAAHKALVDYLAEPDPIDIDTEELAASMKASEKDKVAKSAWKNQKKKMDEAKKLQKRRDEALEVLPPPPPPPPPAPT